VSNYKTVRDEKGNLSVEVADKLAAEMMVATYVPDFEELGLTFTEAYDLACERDNEAAVQLEIDAQQDYGKPDDPRLVAAVNAAFAQAEAEEAQYAEDEYRFIVNTLLQPVAMEAVAA